MTGLPPPAPEDFEYSGVSGVSGDWEYTMTSSSSSELIVMNSNQSDDSCMPPGAGTEPIPKSLEPLDGSPGESQRPVWSEIIGVFVLTAIWMGILLVCVPIIMILAINTLFDLDNPIDFFHWLSSLFVLALLFAISRVAHDVEA